MLLIIQEELEAALTGFHVQLETVERLRGKSEPGGGVAASSETRQRETFEREESASFTWHAWYDTTLQQHTADVRTLDISGFIHSTHNQCICSIFLKKIHQKKQPRLS